MPYIHFADNPSRSFELQTSPCTIGRSSDNFVVLPAESKGSRHHAELSERDGTWSVHDLGSLNGTYVNGRKIEWPRTLEEGDKIQIGNDVMVFTAEPPAATEPQPAENVQTPARTVMLDQPAASASPPPEFQSVPADSRSSQPVSHSKPAAYSSPIVSEDAATQVRDLGLRIGTVMDEMGRVIVGQKEVVRHLMMALIARGHVLMVGLPGLAKTLMVRTLAEVLDLRFRRIQFTPDLMPTDITGTDVLEIDEATGHKSYRFIRGPVFTNILLADEINRTPPKTQAALLEAMQEYHVTAAGETYPLQPPFFVLATQNPLEQEGTYPLPEAQLDRFMFSLKVDYPSEEEEENIALSTTSDAVIDLVKKLGAAEIIALQKLVRRLPVSEHVVKYATRLARATRPGDPRAPEAVKKWVYCGAGPRATQYLLLAAKAGAMLRGSVVVNASDVRAAAHPVLRHRIFTNFTADSEGVDSDQIITRLLETVAEPGEKDYKKQTA